MRFKNKFNHAVLAPFIGMGLFISTPVAAQESNNEPEMVEVENGQNNMVASWRDMARQVTEKKRTFAAPDMSAIGYKDGMYVRFQGSEVKGSYAEAVEKELNYHLSNGIDPKVVFGILQGSIDIGTDFRFNIRTAIKEASGDCRNHPTNTSARGCYGITKKTFYGIIRNWGDQYGFNSSTDREDPYWGTILYGAMMKHEAIDQFEKEFPGQPMNAGYLRTHGFLGLVDNAKMIRLMETSPNANARRNFMSAASRNETIFRSYRSVEDVFEIVSGDFAEIENFQIRPPELEYKAITQGQKYVEDMSCQAVDRHSAEPYEVSVLGVNFELPRIKLPKIKLPKI